MSELERPESRIVPTLASGKSMSFQAGNYRSKVPYGQEAGNGCCDGIEDSGKSMSAGCRWRLSLRSGNGRLTGPLVTEEERSDRQRMQCQAARLECR
jgi:hypothetical protein